MDHTRPTRTLWLQLTKSTTPATKAKFSYCNDQIKLNKLELKHCMPLVILDILVFLALLHNAKGI